jgi:hypothetical protein
MISQITIQPPQTIISFNMLYGVTYLTIIKWFLWMSWINNISRFCTKNTTCRAIVKVTSHFDKTLRFVYSDSIPNFKYNGKQIGQTTFPDIYVRDRPFNLQRGVWFFVSFRIFFPECNIRLWQKLWIRFFFSFTKIRIFFSAILGIRVIF